MLAAASQSHPACVEKLRFSPDASLYASSNGLKAVLSGGYSHPVRSKKQGKSYTKLTRLATHTEVDACNSIINDLIFEQFAGYSERIVGMLAKVVGELHDNVASHASGCGFSSAQVYNDASGRRIEFAIADTGCGMLRNVRRVDPSVVDDPGAIVWCLKKGNTTARSTNADGWAQRLPNDAVCNPFPVSVRSVQSEDHHVGEGLWRLHQLIEAVNGSLWVLSGSGEFRYLGGERNVGKALTAWNGVAIEFEIIVPRDSSPSVEREDELEELGRRLGI